jgi:hypothetical protein
VPGRYAVLSRGTRRPKPYSFWLVTLAAFSLVAIAFTTPATTENPIHIYRDDQRPVLENSSCAQQEQREGTVTWS